MAEAGMRVDYFCAVGPIGDQIEKSGLQVHCLNQPELVHDPRQLHAAARGVWNSQASRLLGELLADCDPRSTVVHFHGWTKALSSSVLRVASRMGFACVTTLHEYFTACPNGGFYDYQKHEICTRKAMGFDCLATHCDTRSFAHKTWRSVRQAVAINFAGVPGGMSDVIYISDFSRRILEPYFSAHTAWHFVRNPVNATKQPRVAAEESGRFLFVGRLSPEKGVELFAEAAAMAGVQAAIAGNGELRDSIAARWPNIEMLGWLAGAQVESAIRTSRALVFPSRWYETQGLVVQEALAHGVPVIVGDGTAARDAVREGGNGLLFRQGDAQSLASAMRAMGDDDRVAAMSGEAFEGYWRSPPTIEAHCDALSCTYEAVLARHQKKLAA